MGVIVNLDVVCVFLLGCSISVLKLLISQTESEIFVHISSAHEYIDKKSK